MDDKLKKQAETEFIRARIWLLQKRPFYAHLCMKLRLQWLESCPGGLSATDGESLFINPAAFVKLSKPQQVTTLVHEVLHPAMGHLWRRGSRDPLKWNIAGDICIDTVIGADGFELGPWEAGRSTWLGSHKLTLEQFNGQVAERIYEQLPDPPKGPCGCGGGSGGGCFIDKAGADSAEHSEAEARWRGNVIEAGQFAGSGKGAWQELVKAASPKPPFHLKLFEYLNRGLGGNADWAYLNRRWMYRGLYLPTDTRVVMGRVAWVTDTSGSMDNGSPLHSRLNLAFGYFRGFRNEHPCEADLICCDAGVQSHKTYAEHETLPEEFDARGRGGTSFDAPFELLREKKIEPRVLIYATDAYGSCTVSKPPYPVLWLVIGGDKKWKSPFGEVVYVPCE